MSGDVVVTNKLVDVYIEFTQLQDSARAPNWFQAYCTLCDTPASGSEVTVTDWAYDHVMVCENLDPYTDAGKKRERPHPAHRILEELERVAETIRQAKESERQLVAQARRAGCSWSMIGKALGMNRQKAHYKYRDVDGVKPKGSDVLGVSPTGQDVTVREAVAAARARVAADALIPGAETPESITKLAELEYEEG